MLIKPKLALWQPVLYRVPDNRRILNEVSRDMSLRSENLRN